MNRPHQFKHRDVVRAVRAATAAGIANPKIEIRLSNGTTIAVAGADERPATAAKPAAVVRKPAAAVRKPVAVAVVKPTRGR